MKNTKTFTSLRSFRYISFACCLCILLIAATLEAPAPAEANKDKAPAKSEKIVSARRAVLVQTGRQFVGEWGPVENLDTVPVHISMLPDGRLLYWGRDKAADLWDRGDGCLTYTWHPTSKAKLTIGNYTTNLFCSGHSHLPDGRLLVTGGHVRDNANPSKEGIGEDDVNVFDPVSNTWTRLAVPMPKGRWYPSNVTLGTGETVIVSGYAAYPARNDNPDIFTLTGHIRPFTASSAIPVYPYLHLAPNGNMFSAGPGPGASKYFNPNGNNGGGLFTSVSTPPYVHIEGTAVSYEGNAGRILMIGGRTGTGGETFPYAEIIDLNSSSPFWQPIPSMTYKRKYHNATVLPDGKVLVTGGTQCTGGNTIDCAEGAATHPELFSETWNAQTSTWDRTWTTMAPNPSGIPRVYHSVGLLLPDARVLVGGGGLPAAVGETANGTACTDPIQASNDVNCRTFGHKDVEIFSPPYLFNSDGSPATQPIITAPQAISYGQTFSVGVANASSMQKVSLIRLPSVTHGFNQDQRINFLTFSPNGSSALNVTAPAQANLCPPGYYMLFVVNANGVPSKASIIKVQQDDGYLDGADCNQIWGWAWDRNNPNTPVNVDIYDGSTYLATVSANIFRQDLLNAGKGNGYHAFSYSIPASLKDGRTHSLSVRFSGSSNNLGSSPRPITCGASLFPTINGTVTEASGGGSTWEQATMFTSAINGKITHLRYYRVPGESGTHVGRLWSDTGTLLRQQTFTNETASGWQEVALTTPYTITAGVTYRVSYNVNFYGAKVLSGMASPIMNWPLTATGARYATPSGTFPNTGSVSNFLADVKFSAP
jgi:hypothetical protein